MVETVGALTDAYVTKVDGTATSLIRQYGMSAVDIAYMDTQETASDAFAAYNTVKMAIVGGGDATGLANDATAYTATVTVDGADQAISVDGSAAQTITDLVAQLNLDLTGVTAAIDGADITITHDTAGESNQISIVDIDLFSSVTGFSKVGVAVGGG